MISRLLAAGEWLWHLPGSTVERIEVWFMTRPWELATGGIPACLVATVVLFVILGQGSKPAVVVAEPYRQAFHAALVAKDYERAKLFLRKLTGLKVADDGSRFQFALLANETGKSETALEQIWALAPEDRVGYPPAHLWLATRELRRRTSWTAEDRQRCVLHLAAAKSDAALRPNAAELLGVFYFVEQDYEAAVEELKSIHEPTLNSRIALTMAYQLAGRQDDERNAWSAVATASERQLAAAPDRADIRVLLAVACSHLQENDRAVQVVREGLRRPSGVADRRLQRALGLARAQQLNSILPPPEEAADRESLLQELLDMSTDSSSVAPCWIRWPAQEAGADLAR